MCMDVQLKIHSFLHTFKIRNLLDVEKRHTMVLIIKESLLIVF